MCSDTFSYIFYLIIYLCMYLVYHLASKTKTASPSRNTKRAGYFFTTLELKLSWVPAPPSNFGEGAIVRIHFQFLDVPG